MIHILNTFPLFLATFPYQESLKEKTVEDETDDKTHDNHKMMIMIFMKKRKQ